MLNEVGSDLRRLIAWDPHEDSGTVLMQFHLTYAGPLLASNTGQRDTRPARVAYKHRLRRFFHVQLKELVSKHAAYQGAGTALVESCKGQWQMHQHNFFPLVNKQLGLVCGLDILMMQRGDGGYRWKDADIDNRLKTLIDALRLPDQKSELGDSLPTKDEDPFFVLLQDDALVTRLALETSQLLQPVSDEEWKAVSVGPDAQNHGPDQYGEKEMVRLNIAVTIRTRYTNSENIVFEGI